VITLTFFTILGALAIDGQLAADAKTAIKRADLTLDYVSRVTGIPIQRLSDQLNGKTPFTGFWRLFTGEMRQTDFALEFFDIQAGRIDAVVLRGERLIGLVMRMDVLLGSTPKPVAKASLMFEEQKEQVS
jgi:hypothetical protein